MQEYDGLCKALAIQPHGTRLQGQIRPSGLLSNYHEVQKTDSHVGYINFVKEDFEVNILGPLRNSREIRRQVADAILDLLLERIRDSVLGLSKRPGIFWRNTVRKIFAIFKRGDGYE